MLILLVISTLVISCVADGRYGYVGGRYDVNDVRAGSYGFGDGTFTQGIAASGGIIPAAVISRHTVDYRDFESQYQPINPQIIEVDAGVLPLSIHFKSASSRINVVQSHSGQAGGEESTSSEDEPYRLYHTVTKPIIQEVREVITPYRRVVQEIKPVQEDVQTIVARDQARATGVGTGISTGVGIGTGIRGSYGNNAGIYGGVGVGKGIGYGVGTRYRERYGKGGRIYGKGKAVRSGVIYDGLRVGHASYY